MSKYHKLYERTLSGFELSKAGHQCLAWCPFHDDEGSGHKGFTANLDDGTWYCFSCEEGGSAEKFSDKLKLPQYQPDIEYERILTLEEELLKKNVEADFGPMKWPDTFKFFDGKETSIVRKRGLEYLLKRGMTLEQIIRLRIGFCIDGKYASRVIVPFFDEDDRLVYFVARSIADKPLIPYLNPAEGSETIKGSGDVLFNYNEARTKQRIVICEGVFDAIAVGRTGVATLGKNLSKRQSRMLRETRANELIVCLDGDAKVDARNMALNLTGYGRIIKVADIPDGEDPGSLPRNELSKILVEAEEVTLTNTVSAIIGD